jgi:thiamine biosynthesis protein ThiS
MNNTIEIIINGFPENIIEGTTISDLVTRYKEGDVDLIVEHNGRFIYPRSYGDIVVSNSDRIEFINPNFGG